MWLKKTVVADKNDTRVNMFALISSFFSINHKAVFDIYFNFSLKIMFCSGYISQQLNVILEMKEVPIKLSTNLRYYLVFLVGIFRLQLIQ